MCAETMRSEGEPLQRGPGVSLGQSAPAQSREVKSEVQGLQTRLSNVQEVLEERRSGRARQGLSSMSERSPVMATHEAKRGWNEVTGAVRGSFRSVLLGWTDPVSGDRLTVRMRGEDGLLASL